MKLTPDKIYKKVYELKQLRIGGEYEKADRLRRWIIRQGHQELPPGKGGLLGRLKFGLGMDYLKDGSIKIYGDLGLTINWRKPCVTLYFIV